MNDAASPLLPAPLPEALPLAAATDSSQPSPYSERRLRLWPGVVIVVFQWFLITIPGVIAPNTMVQFFGLFWGPILGASALAAWWLFGSRLRWADRWLGVLTFVAAGAVAFPLLHPTFGFPVVIVFALRVVTTAWVLWLIATPFLRWPLRRAGLLVVFLVAWGYFT